jgi:hypothetical protein
MEEQTLNRRSVLGGMAAAGAAGLLGGVGAPNTAAAAVPDVGVAQSPPITNVKGKVAYVTGGSSGIGLGIVRVLHEAGMQQAGRAHRHDHFDEWHSAGQWRRHLHHRQDRSRGTHGGVTTGAA